MPARARLDRLARQRRRGDAVLRGADLRVADVVREHAAARPETVAVKQGEPRAHVRDARRALEQARPGPARRRGGPGLADRLPRSVGTRDRRAAVRREQDRRRRGAAQLAARRARAADGARGRAGAAPDRRAGVRGDRGRGRRRARSHRRGSSALPREYEEWLAAHEAVDPGGRGESGDVVLQLYTSGTTGVPKGVLTTHRNLAACAETSPYWQFDAGDGLRDAAADVPHRRDRLDVPRPLERCDDDPRAGVRPGGGARPPRARARDQRDLRADDAADADRRPRRRPARLLGAALDRLRRLADHDAGAEGGAAHVPLLALRGLRADREHGRRRAARPGGPRPGRAAGAPAPLGGQAAALGGAPDRRPRDRARARAARGRRGVAAGSQRDAGVLRAPGGDGRGADPRRLAAHGRRRLRRRGRATSSSPTASRT